MKLPFRASFLLAALALCAGPSIALAQNAAPKADAGRIGRDIAALADDRFLGRAPATPGEELTVNYIRDQLQAAGVQPGGTNGSWFQEVPLVRSEIVGTPVLSATIGGQVYPVTQGEQVAIRATMHRVDRVTVTEAPLVFLGYGVRAPERNWDDFGGQDLRGKIGLVLINDPDFETGEGDFGGKAMTYYGRWTYKYEEAARQGLTGLLIIHETAPASYGWATVKNSNTNAMFDIERSNPEEINPLVAGWVQRDDAERLFAAVGQDFESLKRLARSRDFRPVPLHGAAFSVDYAVKRETIRTKNVLGRIPGTMHPDHTVMYGAHWDHLGIGAADARGDSIYNGAVDNAAGTAAVLEIARMFAAGPAPHRSVVFAFWTAEERGLLGSEYYASNPVYPLETTAAGINIDAPLPVGRARNIVVVGYGQSDLEDRLKPLLDAQNRGITPDPNPEAGYFFRSDHFPMAKRGVPMLYTDNGNDLLEGGIEAGEAADAAYRRDAYHQPADNYDPATWKLDGVAEDATVLYQLGASIARTHEWPNYRENSEFRPIRDRSAAARRR